MQDTDIVIDKGRILIMSGLYRVFILVACSLTVFSCTTTKQVNSDIFHKVAGTWEWKHHIGTDRYNPHTITFSDDNKIANFTTMKPFKSHGNLISFYTYNVLSNDDKSITMSLNGETRKTDSGDLVVWILFLKGTDVYCWRRTDWKSSACTKDIVLIKR